MQSPNYKSYFRNILKMLMEFILNKTWIKETLGVFPKLDVL